MNTKKSFRISKRWPATCANLSLIPHGPRLRKLIWEFQDRPDAFWRYAQGVRRLNLIGHRLSTEVPHRAHIREAVVHFLDWTMDATKWSRDKKSMKVSTLLYVLERLGGNAADLVSFSIPVARKYRKLRFELGVNPTGWEVLPLTAFSEALSRCDATTRANGLLAFKNMPQIKDPLFLSFILHSSKKAQKGCETRRESRCNSMTKTSRTRRPLNC